MATNLNETLLKNVIHHLRVCTMVKPPLFMSIQSLLHHGIIRRTSSNLAGFAMTNRLTFHHISLPHCQVLDAFYLDYVGLPLIQGF